MITEKDIKDLRESYRKIAFPKGGAKTIKTRDAQNRALVARGGYMCCQYLLEVLQRKIITSRRK